MVGRDVDLEPAIGEGVVAQDDLVVTARNGGSGDASAIFVNAAALLDMRNNLVSYTNADNAGSAINVPNASRLTGFTSDNNWFSSKQANGRHLVWNGSRVNLGQWSRSTGHDAASLASTPPSSTATPMSSRRTWGGRKVRMSASPVTTAERPSPV